MAETPWTLFVVLLLIFLSASLVWLASWLIHTLPLWHKGDYQRLPYDGLLVDAFRPNDIPPGQYTVTRATNTAEMRSAEFSDRMKKGPVMLITVLSNGPMNRSQLPWFLYTIFVSFVAAVGVAYAFGPFADAIDVFQLAGATAFVGYAMALSQMSIWYHRAWSLTIKDTFDGLIYALLTAGVFALLWPGKWGNIIT